MYTAMSQSENLVSFMGGYLRVIKSYSEEMVSAFIVDTKDFYM